MTDEVTEPNVETQPFERASALGATVHWSIAAAISLGGFGLQSLLMPVNLFDRNFRATGRLYRHMGWNAARLSPEWDFHVAEPLPEYRPSRTVVISNHQSQADPFLISGLPWEMKWLGKKSLFDVPIMGWSMYMAGDIALTRGDRESAKRAMAKCASYLQRDMPVMIFPEGTRSKDGNLLPFKDGAFRLAVENGADILPLAVAGTRYALPKGSMRPGKARGYVAMGQPISTEGMTLDDVPALMERARTEIEALRARIVPLSSEADEV